MVIVFKGICKQGHITEKCKFTSATHVPGKELLSFPMKQPAGSYEDI